MALNPSYNIPRIGVVVFALIVMLLFIIWKRRSFTRANKKVTSLDDYERGSSHISPPLEPTAPSSSQIQLKPMPLSSGQEYQNARSSKKCENWLDRQYMGRTCIGLRSV